MEIRQTKLDDATIARLSQPAVDAINNDAEVLYSDTENFRYGDKSIFADSELAEKDGLIVVQLNPETGAQEINFVPQSEAEDVTLEEPEDLPEEEPEEEPVIIDEPEEEEPRAVIVPTVVTAPQPAPVPVSPAPAPENGGTNYKTVLKWIGLGVGAIAALLLLRKGAKSLFSAFSKNKNTATRLSSFDVRRAATRQGLGFGNPNYNPAPVVRTAEKPAPKMLEFVSKEPPKVTPEDVIKMQGKPAAASAKPKTRIGLTDHYANMGDKAPKYVKGTNHDAVAAEIKAKAALKKQKEINMFWEKQYGKQISSVRTELNAANENIKSLEAQLKAAEEAKAAAAAKPKTRISLTDKYANMGDKAPKYVPGENHDALVAEMKANAAQSAKTAQGRKRLVDEVHRQTENAQKANLRANKLQLKNGNLTRHANGLEKQVTALKSEVDAATRNIETLEAQLKAAKADSTTQKGLIEQLQGKLDSAKASLKETRKAYNKAYAENTRIKNKMLLRETNLKIAKAKKEAVKLVQTTEETVKEYLRAESQVTAIRESLKQVKRGSVEANNLRNALEQAKAYAGQAKQEAKDAIKTVMAQSETSTYVRESITTKRQTLFAQVFEKPAAKPAPKAKAAPIAVAQETKTPDIERPVFTLTGVACEHPALIY